MNYSFEQLNLKPTNTLYPLRFRYGDEEQTCDSSVAEYLVIEHFWIMDLFERIEWVAKELEESDMTRLAVFLLDSALWNLEHFGMDEFLDRYADRLTREA
jgi:hypothetical protein